jgi:DNA-binding response OmpR family regulator
MIKKILVVDDDTGVTKLIEASLNLMMPGFEVDLVNHFDVGMEIARTAKIHDYIVVLLDGQINTGHGYDIAEVLRVNGYKGIIFSIAGRAFCDAVPQEKRWLYNGSYQKPVPFHELAGELLDVWLKECED